MVEINLSAEIGMYYEEERSPLPPYFDGVGSDDAVADKDNDGREPR